MQRHKDCCQVLTPVSNDAQYEFVQFPLTVDREIFAKWRKIFNGIQLELITHAHEV